jgi:bifunctional non-homologous end joining protein LigD
MPAGRAMPDSEPAANQEGGLRFIQPMLAATEEEVPGQGKWSLAVKLDGIRAVAIKNGAQTRLFSRRPGDISEDYPEIVQAVAGLPARQLMVDGEIAALDEKGRSSFQLLQNAKRNPAASDRVFSFMSDLMREDGRDTTSLPLVRSILWEWRLWDDPWLEASRRRPWFCAGRSGSSQ